MILCIVNMKILTIAALKTMYLTTGEKIKKIKNILVQDIGNFMMRFYL